MPPLITYTVSTRAKCLNFQQFARQPARGVASCLRECTRTRPTRAKCSSAACPGTSLKVCKETEDHTQVQEPGDLYKVVPWVQKENVLRKIVPPSENTFSSDPFHCDDAQFHCVKFVQFVSAGLQNAFKTFGPMKIEWPGKDGKHPRYLPRGSCGLTRL